MDKLNGLLVHLHTARMDSASAKKAMNDIVENAKNSVRYQREAALREMAEKDIETITEKIHDIGLEIYKDTGEKSVNDFIKIREEKVFSITDTAAMRAFVEKRLTDALIVDEGKVKNYAIKIGPVDGTTVTIQPKVTIATDLSGVVYE